MVDSFVVILVLVSGFCVASVVIDSQMRRRALNAAPTATPTLPQAIFVFRNGFLVDANTEGLSLLGSTSTAGCDWSNLRAALADQFPDFPHFQSAWKSKEVTVLRSHPDTRAGQVSIDQCADLARVSVVTSPSEPLLTRTACSAGLVPEWVTQVGELFKIP